MNNKIINRDEFIYLKSYLNTIVINCMKYFPPIFNLPYYFISHINITNYLKNKIEIYYYYN